MLAFAGVALVLAMVPGPATAVMVRQGLRGGPRAALATTAGAQVALAFWSVAAAFGLSALVAASQAAYDALRITGAAVLVVLGASSLLRSRGPGPVREDGRGQEAGPGSERVPGWRAFRVGVATDLANPKAAVFALSFLPQFVPAGAPVLATTLLLGLVWVAVDAAWYAVLTLLLARSRAVFARARVRRRLERVSGAVLIGLGVRVALQRR